MDNEIQNLGGAEGAAKNAEHAKETCDFYGYCGNFPNTWRSWRPWRRNFISGFWLLRQETPPPGTIPSF